MKQAFQRIVRALPQGARTLLLASRIEAGLWCVAVLCSAILGLAALQAKAAEQSARSLDTPQALLHKSQGQARGNVTAPQSTPEVAGDGGVMGRLEIPKVALSVPVLENYDSASLRRGVGHIPGTAFPGGLGNLGLAGHRDTFFRPLRNIHTGMEIDVITSEGRYKYQIDSTEIVTPDKVEVLDIRNRPELTLITCYPFNFIGSAPKRFIVHAHLLSLDPG